MDDFLVATFYLFVTLKDCESLRASIHHTCDSNGVTGTVLLAHEGINGTITGRESDVAQVLAWLRADNRFANLTHKVSTTDEKPFKRLKVKVKPEIVKLGLPEIDPATMAGERVKAAQWNELLADPNVVVIDTRNDYEVSIGTFPGAINPATAHFSDLPNWVEQHESLRDKPKVAMFCTGGIRCEKSTALLKAQGFEDVYHLDGGILKYLETVNPQDNRWQGECFVFDDRVSVDHALEPGNHVLCQGCGRPVARPATHCEFCISAHDAAHY